MLCCGVGIRPRQGIAPCVGKYNIREVGVKGNCEGEATGWREALFSRTAPRHELGVKDTEGREKRLRVVIRGTVDERGETMESNEITAQIVDAAYRIHTQLGPGLLESVYEVILARELEKRGFRVRRQVSVPIEFDGVKFDEGFRIDLLVEELVVVEIKSVERNHPVHAKQLRTHLVLAKLPLGLVVNFGLERIKDGITRIINGYPDGQRERR